MWGLKAAASRAPLRGWIGRRQLVGIGLGLLFHGGSVGHLRIGSLIGINRGFVDACFATGPVQGDHFIGGLVGRNYKGVIQECYAAGPVAGNRWVGGLTGNAVESEAIACFWDTTTSGTTFSAGGTGETTATLMLPQTYTAAGWDFNSIWGMRQGKEYPYLKSVWK